MVDTYIVVVTYRPIKFTSCRKHVSDTDPYWDGTDTEQTNIHCILILLLGANIYN